MTHPSGPNRCFACGQWPCACIQGCPVCGGAPCSCPGGARWQTSLPPVATGGFYAGASMAAPQSYHYGGYLGSRPRYPQTDAPPEDEPLTTPDLIEPVVAWRSWTLEQNGDLRAANGHVSWRPGPNEAVCGGPAATYGAQDHPAPQEKCSCGFYGYHDPETAEGLSEILGLFKAWGTIVLHPTGLRSQWAEIALLVVPDSLKDDSRIKRMREHYGVPCVSSIDEAKYRAEEHGRAVPEEMRPEAPRRSAGDAMTAYLPPGTPVVNAKQAAQMAAAKNPRRGYGWAGLANLVALVVNIVIASTVGGWHWLPLALVVVNGGIAASYLTRWAGPRVGCALRHAALTGDCGHWGLCVLSHTTREKYGRTFQYGDRCPRCDWKMRRALLDR